MKPNDQNDEMSVLNLTKEMQKKIMAFWETSTYKRLNLYPYQKEAIENFSIHLGKGLSLGYFTATTGSGKTRMILSKIIATDSKAIVLVPSVFVADKAKKRIVATLKKMRIKKFVGSTYINGVHTYGDIVIMTYQSLRVQMNRERKKTDLNLDDYPLVIVDEAHYALTKYTKEIVEKLARSKIVIGCSAIAEFNTKRRYKALSSLEQLFGEHNGYFNYPIMRAIEEKYLSPVHVCMVTPDVLLNWQRSRTKVMSEITENAVAEKIDNDAINTIVAEIYVNCIHPNTGKPLFGQQAVSFCAGGSHARAVSDKFNELFSSNRYLKVRGIKPAAYLSGVEDIKERKILEDFQNGKILMLAVNDALVTELNNPNIVAAFNLRPTRSKALALQRSGQIVRKSVELPDKVALIFEFNWGVDHQVFLQDILGEKHILGDIPAVPPENKSLEVLCREPSVIQFKNAAYWELDWTGRIRCAAMSEHCDFDSDFEKISVPIEGPLGDELEPLFNGICRELSSSTETDINYLLTEPTKLLTFSPAIIGMSRECIELYETDENLDPQRLFKPW